MTDIKSYLQKLTLGEALNETETESFFDQLLSEDSSITPAQIGAYLFATASRPITASEFVGAARSMRSHMLPVKNLTSRTVIDTCGTGGSGLEAFNTSTVAAFVVAAAGQPVAKHGNRAATSRCGSADLLNALGVSLELSPACLAALLKETNFCFIFAPNHHPATKRAQTIRKELGFRTIFNFLGPLVNPAGAELQLLGVSSREMLQPMAEALLQLGTKRAMVVTGEDGLDEITLTGPTLVCEITGDAIKNYRLSPTELGFPIRAAEELRGSDPQSSAETTKRVLNGEQGAVRDLVVINAAASLFLAGVSSSLQAGIRKAQDILDSGEALATLQKVINVSKKLSAN